MLRSVKTVLIAALSFMLLSCDTAEKVIEVIKDPSIEVGGQDDQASMITLQAFASKGVNKNFDGEPSPVTLRVFALSSDHRFYGFDFFSLAELTQDSLGITLLEELDEAMMTPNSFKILGPYEMPPKTKKLAVIVEYLDIETTTWRSTIDIEAMGQNKSFLLLLTEEDVRLLGET